MIKIHNMESSEWEDRDLVYDSETQGVYLARQPMQDSRDVQPENDFTDTGLTIKDFGYVLNPDGSVTPWYEAMSG